MLVLTRMLNQGVTIGGDIEVRVLGINGNQIKLGVEAPKEVLVLRTELLERAKIDGKKDGDKA